MKFNPVDKSNTHIGPDFGGGFKWLKGAMTDNGIIYCPNVNPVLVSSRSIRILTMSQNWIEIFSQNVGVCGHHVLSLLMDAFTSCHAMLVE